jgi:hypothetical protein
MFSTASVRLTALDRLWARDAGERLAAYRRGDLAAKDLKDIVARYRP